MLVYCGLGDTFSAGRVVPAPRRSTCLFVQRRSKARRKVIRLSVVLQSQRNPTYIMRILCPAKDLLLTVIPCPAEGPFVTVRVLRKTSCLLLVNPCPAEGPFVTVCVLRKASCLLLCRALPQDHLLLSVSCKRPLAYCYSVPC